METQIERGGRTYIYYPEPMPLSVDLDGDGIEEIVVPQNQFPGRLAVDLQGPGRLPLPDRQLGLRGHGAQRSAPFTGDGTPALVVAVTRYTNMFNTQGETQIIMTTTE